MTVGTVVTIGDRVGTVLCGYSAYPDDVAVQFADFHVERVARAACTEVRHA